MKTIPLSNGLIARVSDESHNKLTGIKWYPFRGRNGTIYAEGRVREHGKCHRVLMHRYITEASKGQEVDHRDSNGLNNQLDNLRVCTRRQNSRNRKSLNKNNTSGYHGVSYCKRTGKWEARIMVDRKQVWLGRHNTKEDAALAYNLAAKIHHGEFATLNIIPDEFRIAA
jgi:AP2 domain/HNH endonuclease